MFTVAIAALTNTQAASAVTFTKARCELVKITYPTDGAVLNNSAALKGYAKFGSSLAPSLCLVNVPCSDLHGL